MYSFTLVLIASACFTAMDVTELPDGSMALKTLPSITDETDDFGTMIAYGVIGLLLFLIIIPGFFFVQIKKANTDGSLWSPKFRAQLGPLFMRYRPNCWWYEFVVMGRKIILAAAAILCPGTVAIVVSMVVIGASIAVHLQTKPFQAGGHRISKSTADDADDKGDGEGTEVSYSYTNDSDEDSGLNKTDKLEILCLGAVMISYLLGLICAAAEPKNGSGLAIFVIVLAVLTLMAPIGGAVALNRGSADDDKVEVEFKDTRFENPANEIENDSPGSPSFDNENDSTSFDTE